MEQLEATAKSWATLSAKPGTKEHTQIYDAVLIGWAMAEAQAVQCLKSQHERCPPGLLVSYAIAADVLKLDMKEAAKRPVETTLKGNVRSE